MRFLKSNLFLFFLAGMLIFWIFILPVPHIPTVTEVTSMGFPIPLVIIVLFIWGVVSFVFDRRRKYLVKNGIKIVGKIQKYDTFSLSTGPVLERKMYKRVCTEAEFEGEKKVFKSDILLRSWKDVFPPVGTNIDVYIDPKNTKKYFVDVRFLQK